MGRVAEDREHLRQYLKHKVTKNAGKMQMRFVASVAKDRERISLCVFRSEIKNPSNCVLYSVF